MSRPIERMAFIDALKAIASQLIVLHHLAFYGPMSDVANTLAPSFFAWLSTDARFAVQVFLVIGGFLAARALAPNGYLLTSAPLSLIKKRYLKLITPYLAAILISVVCAAIARQLIDHDSIPDRPTLRQFLSHIVLLQNVLDLGSLSAGAWYIGIDFQLFSLMLGLLWLAHLASARAKISAQMLSLALIITLALGSLFYFNRNAAWDSWAIYFFVSYALGALTYWITAQPVQSAQSLQSAKVVRTGMQSIYKNRNLWFAVIVLIVGTGLIIDFRPRLAVALVTALVLAAAQQWRFLEDFPKGRVLAYLGKISYSVFLIHFSVLMLINAAFTYFAPENLVINTIGVFLAWAASIAAGALFYSHIESRANHIQAACVTLANTLFQSAKRAGEWARLAIKPTN